MLALEKTDCPLANKKHPQLKQARSQSHKFHITDNFENCCVGPILLASATATYQFKGEDRTALWRNAEHDDIALTNSGAENENSDSPPALANNDSTSPDSASSSFLHLLAFCGVFDGHGGPLAADYCAKGLLPHIMLETEKGGVTDDLPDHPNRPLPSSRSSSPRLARRPSLRKVLSKSRLQQQHDPAESPEVKKATTGMPSLEAAYVRGFHNCQFHFGTGEEPLSVPPPPRGFARKSNSLRNLISRPFQHHNNNDDDLMIGGGTTACTLSIYSSPGPSNPGIFAVVANCGDSRLICDKGSREGPFAQVTRDHRPLDPVEYQRLKEATAEEGDSFCHVQHLPHHQGSPARIFPGGLAVARTIGDLNYSKAVVPTPDVYRWRLDREEGEDEEREESSRTHRFVLASDGLWDVTTSDNVGVLAAQQDSDGAPVSPRSAASRVMEHCLECGGFMDDVTIMIVDVSLP